MKNGFTLVEILAVIAIMGLIIVISVPAYNGISNSVRENSYNSKIAMMEKSTKSFVDKYYKDKVYNGSNKRICFDIDYLISKGVFEADNKDGQILNPKTGGTLNGSYLVASYDLAKKDTVVRYDVTETSCYICDLDGCSI